MNEHDDLTERLGHELRDTVDHISDGPITLQDVRGRARRIRRRRATTVGVVAAAVATAVAIPFAVDGSGLLPGDSSPKPADQISALEEPIRLTADAPAGDPPTLPHLDETTLTDSDGGQVELPETYNAFAPAGDEYVAVRQGDPDTYVDVLDNSGEVVESDAITNVAVSSADGSLAAWGTPEGQIKVRQEGETRTVGSLPRPVQPVEVVGSESCGADDECRIFYQDAQGEEPPGVMAADGTTQEIDRDLRTSSAVSPEGLVAGLTTDPGADPAEETCSAIVDTDAGEKTFSTCSLAFFAPRSGFSPEGTSVIAETVDPDGANPAALTVLDPHDGSEIAEIVVPQAQQEEVGRVSDTAWENDEHVLVKTEAPAGDTEFRYTVFRVGLDGSVEQVLQKTVGGGGTQPWILPH